MSADSKTLIIALVDPRTDTEGLLYKGIDVSSRPWFSPQEAARFFFGKHDEWLRKNERLGRLVYDGVQIEAHRLKSGQRRYDLAIIEKIAYALADARLLNGAELQRTMALLRLEGEIWGYLI